MGSYRYLVNAEENLLIETFSGTVTLEMLEQVLSLLTRDPACEAHFRSIADFRDASARLSIDDLASFIVTRARMPEVPQGPRAILIKDPITTALAELYKNRLSELQAMRVCATPEAAADWLGLPAKWLLANLSAAEEQEPALRA